MWQTLVVEHSKLTAAGASTACDWRVAGHGVCGQCWHQSPAPLAVLLSIAASAQGPLWRPASTTPSPLTASTPTANTASTNTGTHCCQQPNSLTANCPPAPLLHHYQHIRYSTSLAVQTPTHQLFTPRMSSTLNTFIRCRVVSRTQSHCITNIAQQRGKSGRSLFGC